MCDWIFKSVDKHHSPRSNEELFVAILKQVLKICFLVIYLGEFTNGIFVMKILRNSEELLIILLFVRC